MAGAGRDARGRRPQPGLPAGPPRRPPLVPPDLPRHRTHFTARGLEVLLDRCGFEVERTEHVLLEHNPFGLWQSLVSRVTPTQSWLYHALKRNAPLRAGDLLPTLLALPLVPVALLVEWLAGVARRGGTVAAVSRSRDPG
jgi:hypothetical protein